jgi:hypothetical protein
MASNMATSDTRVVVGGASFDLAGVGGWALSNVWFVLLICAVLFIFYLFQPGGFAEKFMEYRNKKRELDVKQLDAARELSDKLRQQYDRDEPYLPFDKSDDKRL